ncbi:hypothetical protein SCLCIDRAFT_23966 [Scleroderma citrinum Foug A]|uniref:Uncharacterized protein n=1 Tax=Scleroderma citrinum Foug A TaxID=1036808 RepID=A0A0C2ZQF6_9AGAM|nr:hypothetical protein SCLCIDRAFT_23966 [Scleroderma citrinum Foug A]
MSGSRNIRFIDNGAANSGMFFSPGWTPPNRHMRSNSGSDSSSRWSPPKQCPPTNPMSIDTRGPDTLPTFEEGSLKGAQHAVGQSDISPSTEWDSPGVPNIPSHTRTLSASSIDTDSSSIGWGWTPPPPLRPDVPLPGRGWTPPPEPPPHVSRISTPPSPSTSSAMSISPIVSLPIANNHMSTSSDEEASASSHSSQGHDEDTENDSDQMGRQVVNPWPRVVGTNPVAHSRWIDKGKGKETATTDPSAEHPENSEDQWWKLLQDMADTHIQQVGFCSPWYELNAVCQISARFHPKDGKITSINKRINKPLITMYKEYADSEHGMYYRFEFILERAMSVTHIAVILRMRTSPAYEEEFMKMDYPDVRNEYGTS